MKFSDIQTSALPAYEIPFSEESLRYDAQTSGVPTGTFHPYWYVNAIQGLRRSMRQRPAPAAGVLGRIAELDDVEAAPQKDFEAAVRTRMALLQYSAEEAERNIERFCWKIQQLPVDRKNILSIGCGSCGHELSFLRARFPDAQITALDYAPLTPRLQKVVEVLNVTYIPGNLFENAARLKADGRRFDLIFSNHVIEHFYEPDQALESLIGLLEPQGIFSAGLPLAAYAFADKLATICHTPYKAHILDLNWIDLRHPWKTQEADLAAALRRPGLDDVTIFRRGNKASISLRRSREGLLQYERQAERIYRCTLAPCKWLLRLLFGQTPPRLVARSWHALDRRLRFGRVTVLHAVTPEVFVSGRFSA